MNEEEALLARGRIISEVEDLIESGHYTLEEIVSEIEDELCHLHT